MPAGSKAGDEATGEYRLFHYDYRGSTTALTDSDGIVTDRVVYSPYGKIEERTGNTETAFLYVGQYGVQTDENGLYYMRARYYDPRTSRMLTPDSYWNVGNMVYGNNPARMNDRLIPDIYAIRQSSNLYVYALNNPLRWIDPSGFKIELSSSV